MQLVCQCDVDVVIGQERTVDVVQVPHDELLGASCQVLVYMLDTRELDGRRQLLMGLYFLFFARSIAPDKPATNGCCA